MKLYVKRYENDLKNYQYNIFSSFSNEQISIYFYSYSILKNLFSIYNNRGLYMGCFHIDLIENMDEVMTGIFEGD